MNKGEKRLKKIISIFTLLIVVLAGCNDEEQAVRKELEEIGMNKQEQDATIEAVTGQAVDSDEESKATKTTEDEKPLETFQISESFVPFGEGSFTEFGWINSPDVYYEDGKTLVSFLVEGKPSYYVSVFENGKWVQKDQQYMPLEQNNVNYWMKKGIIYGVKWSKSPNSRILHAKELTIYKDQFLKEGTMLHELTNLDEEEKISIIPSNKGDVVVFRNFDKYILPEEGVLNNFNLDQEKFKRGAYDDCDSGTINLDNNYIYCSSFGTDESRISRYDVTKNEWMYSEDGTDIKVVKVANDGEIVVNSKGVVGTVSLIQPYGEKDYLIFQTFDQDLNLLSDSLKLEVPVNDNRVLSGSNYNIEIQDDAFVVWYQYVYKGKPAIAKYVMGKL
jgi:hypothetical protein